MGLSGLIEKVLDKIEGERLVSMGVHAILGANAALGAVGTPTSALMGAINGLALETIAHTPFANSVAGAPAVVVGYGALAVGNLENNFGKLFGDSDLLKWLRLPKYGAEFRASGVTFEEYMGTTAQQREESGSHAGLYTSTPPAAPIAPTAPTGYDYKISRMDTQ